MTENEANGFAFGHALAAQMLHNTGGAAHELLANAD
jgi:hypothetical protein